jgi:hypothetical protein
MYVGAFLVATLAVLVLALLVVSFFAVRRLLSSWALYRGPKVINCPETLQPAGVEVDTRYAGLSAFFEGEPSLRLASCTRWPEKAGCGQECLAQVEDAPIDCGVRHMLETWYRGKPCIYCRTRFSTITWHDHKPGLVSPEGEFVSWSDVPHDRLPEVLNTHFPVCWNCDNIERFRREHPDLVTDITGRDRRSGVIR